MNNNKLNQLVNQYISTGTNPANIIDPLTTSNIPSWNSYYPYGGNTSSFPYTISASDTWSTFTRSEITKTMDLMPLILIVKNVSVENNKIEITFDKFSHKNWDKFLPDQGSVYFGQEVYGVYDKADYLYWEDTIKVQVEDINAALKVIKKGVLFTTVNNWDERITNTEVFLFLKNIKAYKRYAHLMLENLLDERGEDRNLKQRMNYHSELESQLV